MKLRRWIKESWKRSCPRSRVAELVLAAAACALAQAAEVTVKNDSFVDGGVAVIVGDFVPGEQAGVRLTSPCDGTIVAVQVAWLEGTPGHEPSLERAIHIYDGDSFPTPGEELAYLEAPLLTPGAINEFRYLDEMGTIPISVPVTAGQQFYVTLEYEEPTDVGSGGPSVIRDTDGCQGSKNVLFAIPGGWLNFCLLLQGDLVIRAVVDCGELSGACCLPSGECQYTTPSLCAESAGTYHGDLVTCASVECPQPSGACCFQSTGGCLDLTQQQCQMAAGVWAGIGTQCATYTCFPSGACCLPDGSCIDGVSPEQCAADAGVFQGDGTECATVDCPEPTGACCVASTGSCLVLTEANCAVTGAYWAGYGTTCVDLNQNGQADACEPGDVNCDGAVNGYDIDPFVLALTNPDGYRAAYPDCFISNADANRDGLVNGYDIDPFVLLLTGG
jgi:hypothetical protein